MQGRAARPFRLGGVVPHFVNVAKRGISILGKLHPISIDGVGCSRGAAHHPGLLTSIAIGGCIATGEKSRNICSSLNIPRNRRRLGLTDRMRDGVERGRKRNLLRRSPRKKREGGRERKKWVAATREFQS